MNCTALGKVAIDNLHNRLYVPDPTNNRVLGYNDPGALANGAPADVVIGQKDFFTGTSTACNMAGATLFNMCRPIGTVDAPGNLYVADYGDNRVLKYPWPVVTSRWG